MQYDYLRAVTEDVLRYIRNEMDLNEYRGRWDDLEEDLNDTLWIEDSVTGNASGSYTFSAWQAEEYLCHNLDLLKEAIEEFGDGIEILRDRAEACDVTIRCYLLGRAIHDALYLIEDEIAEIDEQEELGEE